MKCYYQGCEQEGLTREHIPPKAFFPEGERNQLLTVKSCPAHNNEKSQDDMYVLAHICINASPRNRAREVFQTTIVPQLAYNNGSLRKMLAKDAVQVGDAVAYRVETRRFDQFFSALSCGVIFKSQKAQLPIEYTISHIYHNFSGERDVELSAFEDAIDEFYAGKPLDFMRFGNPKTLNDHIYTCELFGLPEFQGSITIVHRFFGHFKVTSMLTRLVDNH